MPDLTATQKESLILEALMARERAVAPHSGFAVGAALLALDGRVVHGANVESVRDLNDIRKIVEQRSTDVCKLLFIGTEWYRKGGGIRVYLKDQL
jgi:hypothetical protein